MDCKSSIFGRTLLLFLLLPATLWGYGKCVFGWPLNTGETSCDGSLTARAGQDKPSKQVKEAIDLKVTAPSQNGFSTEPAVAAGDGSEKEHPEKRKIAEDAPVGGKASSEIDRKESEPGFEPSLSNETYNQVRVRKPSIPSRFDESDQLNRQRDQLRSNSPFRFLGLLGVPTLVFSLLFFTMWGIISGKIQRIMF